MATTPKPLLDLPPEDKDLIWDAATELAMKAGQMVNHNPLYAVGALSMALATVAAIIKTDYAELIRLVSDHYEVALLREVADEFRKAGAPVVMVNKPEEPQ